VKQSVANDGTVCRIWDHRKAGGTIVLIHGLGLNQAMWQAQIDALAVRHCVVTYDLYGHGDSPPPPEAPSLAMFARQFASVLSHLEIPKAVVAGFSLGGMIARRIGMDYRCLVDGLAILHSPHVRSDTERSAIQARVHQAASDGPGATVEAALDRWFTSDFRVQNAKIMDQVRQWVLANDKLVYPEIYQVLVDGVDELVAPEPPLKCPALVLTGDEDYGNNPAMSAAIAQEIAGAELVILQGLRHMAMLEAPEKFNPHLVAFCHRVWQQRGAFQKEAV